MEFSGVGLSIAIAVLLPSFVFLAAPPREELPKPDQPLAIILSERIGQVGCLLITVFTAGPFTLQGWMALIAVAATVAGYWALWISYLRGGRTLDLLYGPVGLLPIPLAVLPVLAFGLTALWGLSIALGVATILFAIGHCTTAIGIARRIPTHQGRARGRYRHKQ